MSVAVLDNPPAVAEQFPDVVDRIVNGTIAHSFSVDCIVDGVGNVHSNLLENATEFILQLSLPGVDYGHLRVEACGRQVVVSGQFRIPAIDEAAWVWQSIVGGEFCEVFRLPGAVDGAMTTTYFDRGILTIHLTKANSIELGPRD
jgi:HSP20 family molecular chaperone IbpA